MSGRKNEGDLALFKLIWTLTTCIPPLLAQLLKRGEQQNLNLQISSWVFFSFFFEFPVGWEVKIYLCWFGGRKKKSAATVTPSSWQIVRFTHWVFFLCYERSTLLHEVLWFLHMWCLKSEMAFFKSSPSSHLWNYCYDIWILFLTAWHLAESLLFKTQQESRM